MYRQSSQINKIFPIHLKIKLCYLLYHLLMLPTKDTYFQRVLYKCVDGLHNSTVSKIGVGKKGPEFKYFYFKSNVRLFSLYNDYEILSCTIQTDST